MPPVKREYEWENQSSPYARPIAKQVAPRLKTTYSTSTVLHNDAIKKECNALFSDTSKPTDIALILDAEEANTSTALHNKGLLKENIHCPNFDPLVAKIIEEKQISTVHVTTLEEFMITHQSMRFNRVWLDGCCAWKKSSPAFKLMFDNQMLSEGVFALTLSMRGETKLSNKPKVIQKLITKMASAQGYKLELLSPEHSFFYKKSKITGVDEKEGLPNATSMLFQMYTVTRC
jgi:hypothetical protein